MQDLQKSLYRIQTAGGNSKFHIWNETAAGREIQNAPCIICKNLRTEFKQWGEFEIPIWNETAGGAGNSKCSVHNLQKSLYRIQTAEGNSKFLIWNETVVGQEIQNALCIICKNLHAEVKQWGEFKIPHMEGNCSMGWGGRGNLKCSTQN
jgi:hypothetical protein